MTININQIENRMNELLERSKFKLVQRMFLCYTYGLDPENIDVPGDLVIKNMPKYTSNCVLCAKVFDKVEVSKSWKQGPKLCVDHTDDIVQSLWD